MKLFGRKIFSWKSPWVKWVVGGFVTVYAVFLLNEAYSADFEVSAGYSSLSTIEVWQVEEFAAEGSVLLGQYDRWEASIGGVSNTTWYGSIARRVRMPEFGIVQPYLSLGLQANEEGDVVLPQWWNFQLGGGFFIGDRWLLELKHASNAGLKEPNRGLNWFMFSYSFGD